MLCTYSNHGSEAGASWLRPLLSELKSEFAKVRRQDIKYCPSDQKTIRETIFIHEKPASLLFVDAIVVNLVYQLNGRRE